MGFKFSEKEMKAFYLQALDTFNHSSFATEKKFFEHPKPLQWAEIITVSQYLHSGGSLLDIGTGTGILPHTFHLMGMQVHSVDLPSETGAPLRRVQDLGVMGNSLEVGPQPLPYVDNSFDVVFAGDVIEHISGSPRHFMFEVIRVLKPGGRLILSTPNAVRLPVRIKIMLGYSNWMPLGEFYRLDINPGHHKEYVKAELLQLMHWSNLDEVAVSLIEDTLARSNLAASLSDIQTKNRFVTEDNRSASFGWLNPLEYTRITMYGLTKLIPSLRSSLLAVGRKASGQDL